GFEQVYAGISGISRKSGEPFQTATVGGQPRITKDQQAPWPCLLQRLAGIAPLVACLDRRDDADPGWQRLYPRDVGRNLKAQHDRTGSGLRVAAEHNPVTSNRIRLSDAAMRTGRKQTRRDGAPGCRAHFKTDLALGDG